MEAQEVPTDVCKHLMGVKKAEPGSSQRHRRKWAQAEVQESPFTCQKMLLFYCKAQNKLHSKVVRVPPLEMSQTPPAKVPSISWGWVGW